ncbi:MULTISPECIES: hypothetical protein [Mucilaginibacter]|jgi:hypothetical protein|uniref:Uncharacterized protein n=2 Tax=Mucilaginibacter TaxID=423349 RepID=A0A6I4ID70_9SPHI|nr:MULTISPECIES: hypothetical protein [Mucilaginibacter]MBB5396918.1 hypothetical protein [Mucilaginibacter sp. AK015]MBL4676569.1 hypothetical protein [Mucilaginibacter sp.]MDT3401126.1 hypothetical protein [Mucilaginibacter terrae]MVN91389.1 hypothetical protein [Mucilaginibacter aquatilis]
MKTIQRYVHYQFDDQAIIIGNKVINIAVSVIALAAATFPFLLLFFRLS